MKKTILLIILTAILLFLNNEIKVLFPKYSSYKSYIDIAIVFGMGWLIIESFSSDVGRILEKKYDKYAGSIGKSITRIIGFGILLAIISGLFNLSSAGALTLGSFFGLVIGMASQTVLKNAAAGVIIAITRPIKPGDKIKIKGIEGILKEIKIMHIVIENEESEYLIPSSKVIEEIIERKKL